MTIENNGVSPVEDARKNLQVGRINTKVVRSKSKLEEVMSRIVNHIQSRIPLLPDKLTGKVRAKFRHTDVYELRKNLMTHPPVSGDIVIMDNLGDVIIRVPKDFKLALVEGAGEVLSLFILELINPKEVFSFPYSRFERLVSSVVDPTMGDFDKRATIFFHFMKQMAELFNFHVEDIVVVSVAGESSPLHLIVKIKPNPDESVPF